MENENNYLAYHIRAFDLMDTERYAYYFEINWLSTGPSYGSEKNVNVGAKICLQNILGLQYSFPLMSNLQLIVQLFYTYYI